MTIKFYGRQSEYKIHVDLLEVGLKIFTTKLMSSYDN